MLVALLLPAVQKACEAAAWTTCTINMHNLGIAIHNYADARKAFPSGGEGTDFTGGGGNGNQPGFGATIFDTHSVFTRLLPYVEQAGAANNVDLNVPYNAGSNLANSFGKVAIPTFLCPTNPQRPGNGVDSSGYGYTDYGPTVYVDIGATGFRDKSTRVDGALHASPGTSSGTGGANIDVPIEQISDGLSKTIALAEDVGRNEFMPGAYPDPNNAGSQRAFHRWAEPDNGYGVSGGANTDSSSGYYVGRSR